MLSRVDGASGVVELSHATGLPEATVVQALERLSALGAIRYPDASPASGRGSMGAGSTGAGPRAPSRPSASGAEPPPPTSVRKPALADVRFDERLLDEEVEIALPQRRELLTLFFAIDIVTHYELLGVTPDADRKAIKQAYFERVNSLHPDRFFGRSIGSYKSRIERVFTALTKAHDTLTRRQSRADYDGYLESRKETTGLRSSRAPTPPTRAAEEAQNPIPAADPPPRMLGLATNDLPPPPTPASPGGSPPNDDAVRRQMARRLKSASVPPPSIEPARAPEQADHARRALDADLRARFDARQKDPTATNRFLTLAGESERTQSWASAVNALKAALELEPDDPKIVAELARVELLADKAYAGRYVEQARYEERDGQYDRAARSYERAARGRGSAELYAHAALCQLRVDSGGRRAVELARKAVTLAPAHVGARIALGRAYFQEGMTASALAEVTRALEVDPKNDEAKRLQAEFKKSG